jgi:phage shock protein A
VNIFRGVLSLFVGGLEKRNPEALLELEKENLRKQIAQYNQGLAAHAGLCERLMTQIRQQEKDEREFSAKTKVHLQAGNQDAAGQYAVRLQSIRQDLTENRAQLESAEKTYRELIRARDVSVQAARTKIENLKSSLTGLKISRATAELNEMASGMISQIGGAGETLNRLTEMVEEERSIAAGRARVARDSVDTSGISVREAEQKAIAAQALAEFAAAEGLALPNAAAAPKPTLESPKSMDPLEQQS